MDDVPYILRHMVLHELAKQMDVALLLDLMDKYPALAADPLLFGYLCCRKDVPISVLARQLDAGVSINARAPPDVQPIDRIAISRAWPDDPTGKTPLRNAMGSGNDLTVQYLIDHGANVCGGDDDPSVLIHARSVPQLEMIVAAMSPARRQAELAVLGHAMMQSAVYSYNVDIVRWLRDRGVDPPLDRMRADLAWAHFIDEEMM